MSKQHLDVQMACLVAPVCRDVAEGSSVAPCRLPGRLQAREAKESIAHGASLCEHADVVSLPRQLTP